MMTRRGSFAPRIPDDIEIFLQMYPNHRSNPRLRANLNFYLNRIPMQPENLTFEEFMNIYSSDYAELEINHGYIQWLFPIPEKGLNFCSQPLQHHELQKMSNNDDIMERIYESYCVMLAFYGIQLKDDDGRPELADDHGERLQNLSDHPHNLLRITRILKCIALFEPLSNLGPQLILFFTALHSDGFIDLSPGRMHGQSLERWWSYCILDDEIRSGVRQVVLSRGRFGEGVWGFKEFNMWFDGAEIEETMAEDVRGAERGVNEDARKEEKERKEEKKEQQGMESEGMESEGVKLGKTSTPANQDENGESNHETVAEIGGEKMILEAGSPQDTLIENPGPEAEYQPDQPNQNEQKQHGFALKLEQDVPRVDLPAEGITSQEKEDGHEGNTKHDEEDHQYQQADWVRDGDLGENGASVSILEQEKKEITGKEIQEEAEVESILVEDQSSAFMKSD